MCSRPAEPAENLARHIPWLARAKEKGADMCFFPEMSITGFCFDGRVILDAAEPIQGDSTAKMIDLARQHDNEV